MHLDSREREILRGLEFVGEGAVAFFADACRLRTSDCPLEAKSHLIGHCLREAESAIRDVLQPTNKTEHASQQVCGEEADQDSREGFRESVDRAIETLGLEPDCPLAKQWEKLGKKGTSLHGLAHRKRLSKPRSLDTGFRATWEAAIEFFEAVLPLLKSRLYKVFQQIDDILSQRQPKSADFLVKRVFGHRRAIAYFFEKCDDPRWIQPLRKKGVFLPLQENALSADDRQPPSDVWHMANYLARMAQKQPDRNIQEEILSIIAASGNRFPLLLARYLDALQELQTSLSAKACSVVEKWLTSASLRDLELAIVEHSCNFAEHLLKEGEARAAIRILASALRGNPDSIEYDYRVKAVTSRISANLAAGNLGKNLGSICALLTTELAWSTGDRVDEEPLRQLCDIDRTPVLAHPRPAPPSRFRERSIFWRVAIEDHPENNDLHAKSHLLASLRDVAMEFCRRDSAKGAKLIVALDKIPHTIFRRLTLFLLSRHPSALLDLNARFLADRRGFDDTDLWHEYSLFLQAVLPNLSNPERSTILKWMKGGPTAAELEEYARFERKAEGSDPSEEQVRQYCCQWKARQMMRLGNALPSTWKRYRSSWKKECTPAIQDPEFPTELMSTLLRSPLTSGNLRMMTTNGMVAELAEHARNRRERRGDELAYIKLTREFAYAVTEAPGKFLRDWRLIVGKCPEFLPSLLSGLHSAQQKGLGIDWSLCLDLMKWVTGIRSSASVGEPGLDGLEVSESCRYVGWILLSALAQGSAPAQVKSIPFDARQKVWSVITGISKLHSSHDDADMTPERALKDLDPWNCPLDAMAIHLAYAYSLWVIRETSETPPNQAAFARLPEVATFLDQRLDPKEQPSLAVWAVLGSLFPKFWLLDRQWVEQRVQGFFPSKEADRPKWLSAWGGYVTEYKPYSNLYDLLRNEYRRAAHEICQSEASIEPDKRADVREFVDHILLFSAFGVDGSDELVAQMARCRHEQVREYVMSHAGHLLGQSILNPLTPSERRARLSAVIFDHFERTKRGEPNTNPWDFRSFAKIFVAEMVPTQRALDMLLEILDLGWEFDSYFPGIETLAGMTDAHLSKVLAVVEKLQTRNILLHSTFGSEDDLRTILMKAIRSGDESMYDQAKKLINDLAAEGGPTFHDLLRDDPDV